MSLSTRRVVITGMGIVSPLGCTLDLFWHLLSMGESAVKPVTSFDTSPFQTCLGAEINDFDPEDFLHRKQVRRMGRATQFAVAASMMAARNSRSTCNERTGQRRECPWELPLQA